MYSNILLVGGAPVTLKTHADILEKCGYRVSTACTMREAMGELRKEAPNLLLLDTNLHGTNACELIHEVRRDADLQSLPVVAFGLNDTISERICLLHAGADAFVSKNSPFDLCTATIMALLRRVELDKKVIRLGSTLLDRQNSTIYVNGSSVKNLTNDEFRLLYALAEQSPRPVPEYELHRYLRNQDGTVRLEEVMSGIKAKMPQTLSDNISHDPGLGYRFMPF
ncbi:MAG: response regulator [bacterium]